MDAARGLLRTAQATNGTLSLDGKPLTSERLKTAIEGSFGIPRMDKEKGDGKGKHHD